MLMPSSSSSWPKVKRSLPKIGSEPTTDTKTPKQALIRPLTGLPPSRKMMLGEAEHGDPEYLGRAEEQRHLGQRRRQQHQREGAGDAAEGRRHDRDLKREAALALLRHRIAVEGRRDGRRRAGNAQQNGGDRAAIHGAVVDARHQAEGDERLQPEGEGHQNRNRHRGAEARHGADDDARDHADDDGGEVRRGRERPAGHGEDRNTWRLTPPRGGRREVLRHRETEDQLDRADDDDRRDGQTQGVADSRTHRQRAERTRPC